MLQPPLLNIDSVTMPIDTLDYNYNFAAGSVDHGGQFDYVTGRRHQIKWHIPLDFSIRLLYTNKVIVQESF